MREMAERYRVPPSQAASSQQMDRKAVTRKDYSMVPTSALSG